MVLGELEDRPLENSRSSGTLSPHAEGDQPTNLQNRKTQQLQLHGGAGGGEKAKGPAVGHAFNSHSFARCFY